MNLIQEKLTLKLNEIADLKSEREALFSNFDENKERISALYYEIEIKKLQYLLLKREQLSLLKFTSKVPEHVSNVEKINETCIGLLRKSLIANGCAGRLN